MTRDEVINLAREVGFDESNAVCAVVVRHSNGSWVGIEERLAMFAKLVAQHEREACAAICESTHENGTRKYTHADECAAAIRVGGEQ